jgi:hypothetical protein
MVKKLAACLPSRGLIHSRTVQGLFDNLFHAVIDWDLLFTHTLPIPDCFNALVEAALDGGADAIWFVEEDMELPKHILDDLLIELQSSVHSVVAADYPITGRDSTVFIHEGKVMAVGMGCMLVSAKVFEALGEPYFRDNVEYGLPEWEPIYMLPGTGYGRQDVDFGYRVNQLGLSIGVLEERIGHFKVETPGNPMSNNGVHKVMKL